MSYATDKGRRAETMARDYLSEALGVDLTRPRTTSRTGVDTGDLHGLPLVVSIKNHERMNLSGWVDEVTEMVNRSAWSTGLVLHKRRLRGNPDSWYITTSVGLAIPLIAAYLRTEQ